jgi:N-acetyl-gamma-glutamyl-phosphate reductase
MNQLEVISLKKIGIVGASGYAGGNIAKLLANNENVQIGAMCSDSLLGKKVSEVFSEIKSDICFSKIDFEELNNMDLVFLAVPHGTAKPIADNLSTKVIDLSADHRYTQTYGLPEIFKEKIMSSTIVANPGCYATACILGAYPIKDKIDFVAFDCISGYSGGGKNNPYDYSENIIAYSLMNHFHKKEICEQLGLSISFTPHVVNAFCGLMSTAHIKLKEEINKDELKEIYEKLYFGSNTKIVDKVPCTKDVVNTDFCNIYFEVDGKDLVVVSVIDNLMKGASSQAIENMKLMLGIN